MSASSQKCEKLDERKNGPQSFPKADRAPSSYSITFQSANRAALRIKIWLLAWTALLGVPP